MQDYITNFFLSPSEEWELNQTPEMWARDGAGGHFLLPVGVLASLPQQLLHLILYSLLPVCRSFELELG